MQPSGILRRKGGGMQGQSNAELERPSSAGLCGHREGVGAGHSTADPAGRQCQQAVGQQNPGPGKAPQPDYAEKGDPFGE